MTTTDRIKELLDQLRDMPLPMEALERVDEIGVLLDDCESE
jgi:hypothetical protein